MHAAFIIFNGMTALDFVGIYDPLTRLKTMDVLPHFRWDVCAFTDEVVDHNGLRFMPEKIRGPLSSYDLLIVPGGFGARMLVNDRGFLSWLETAAPCPLKVSVCTGSLLLGAAGFLHGRTATTHRSAFEALAQYAQVVDERIVDEGHVITARGVTSGIDLGLYLCERLAGREAREKIQRQMDYPGDGVGGAVPAG